MDQASGVLTGYAAGYYQFEGDTYYLDSEGNWFMLDVASRQWLQCGQEESVQQDHAALVASTWNGTMPSSQGINISSNHGGDNHGGGHPQQVFVRPADTQLMVGDSSQSQQSNLTCPFVDGRAMVGDRAGNQPETEELSPSSTGANPGSWESMREGTIHLRRGAEAITARVVSNQQVQLVRGHQFDRFVGSTARDPSEGRRSVALVNQRFPSLELSRRGNGNPTPPYATTVVLSSDSSTSESEGPSKSKSTSKPRDKSTKGSTSKNRRERR